MFGGFIASLDFPTFVSIVHPLLRKPMLAYWVLLAAVPPGALYAFFSEWSCTTREIELTSQDTLVMFTDGVVESFNAQGYEFGEEQLVDLVRHQTNESAASLLESLVEAVRRHSGPAQSDDLTLVVARVRELRR
jgi:hypothetical protein